jgi:membrane associated rhomboid family serine protease
VACPGGSATASIDSDEMSHPPRPDGGGDPSVAGPLDRDASLALLHDADALVAQGEYDLALPRYLRLVGGSDPEIHVLALLGAAEARYRLDDDEGALQAWIVATQAPETPHTWRAWKALAAARVRQRDLPGAARAYREAERRAPADERPEIASRLGWLSKEMGQDRAAERYFGRSRTGFAPPPVVTYAILGLTVAIGIGTLLPSAELLFGLFALDKSAVADGQWWRLVTVTLVHGGLLHLAFNMYALYLVGPVVESLYGPVRMLLVYVATAATGSVASFVTSPIDGVGASGAVFGLFGLLLIGNRVYKPALGRQARALTSQIGMLIAFNLVFGFAVRGIDNAAHIGGLLAGAWLGLILVPRTATLASFWTRPGSPAAPASGSGSSVVLRIGGVVALVAVIAIGLAIGSAR